VVARSQLRGAGLTDHQVRGLWHRGELREILPAIYAVRGLPDSFLLRAWAAALWSGGVVSHRSAARLLDLPGVPSARPTHVTVPDKRFRRSVPGVVVHRLPMDRFARTSMDGIPVTNRARTIVWARPFARTQGARATANCAD
jgi:predicted transcriptional regulator of viral defense system